MSIYGEARAWLRAVALRRKAEREMHEEMNAHIEQAAERFVARGMSERDALHAARREFGNVAVIQEQARDSRGGRWVDNFTTDVRYALRYFARTPLTTVTIVLTMMLAVGGNAALYSVFYGCVFNPPPGMTDDPALVGIRAAVVGEKASSSREFSYTEVMDYGQARAFSSVAGFTLRSAIIDFGKGPEDMFATTLNYVTPNYFSALRVPFAAGAAFAQTHFEEHRETELTAVVSHTLAEKEFGSASAAIAQTLRVNDVIVTIVGVTRAKFAGAIPGRDGRSIWLPVSALPAVERSSAALFESPDSARFYAIGRLANGVSVSNALPEIRQISARRVRERVAATKYQYDKKLLQTSRTELVRLRTDWSHPIGGDAIAALAAYVALDLIVLLVCTTTVSSLLVGNAITRRHEIGVRLSLGASRWRIVRQLITESMLLALFGGASGLTLFAALSRVFAMQMSFIDVSPRWSVAIFTAVFAMMTAVLCGLAPALHATRHALADVLKDAPTGTTSRSRLQRTFVVAQIALAQPLLVLVATFSVLIFTRMGRATAPDLEDRLLVARINMFTAPRTADGRLVGSKDAVRRLENTPGVRAVSMYNFAYGHSEIGALEPFVRNLSHGTGSERIRIDAEFAAPDYFRALDIELVKGRLFTELDTVRNDVPIIVTSKFAEEFLEGAEPIGRRFRMRDERGADRKEIATIVGVVNSSKVGGGAGHIFRPLGGYTNSLLIRTTIPAELLIPTIRAVMKSESPALTIESIKSLASLNRDTRTEMLTVSGIAAGGGSITLLLGCVGLYAVVALAVGQRKREIGIRIALGAKPKQVVSMFFSGGLRLGLIGLAIGLPLSAAAMKIIIAQVEVVDINMVSLTLLVALVVVFVSAAATWFPARRAAQVDPVVALRAE